MGFCNAMISRNERKRQKRVAWTHEELGSLDALNEVVAATLHLDVVGGLARQQANLLVGNLARGAVVDHADEDFLAGHVGQLLHQLGVDDGGEDDEAVADVVEAGDDGVGEEEHLRNVHAADGAVVEGALEPLRRKGLAEVGRDVAELAAQAADALGTVSVSTRRAR